MMNILHMDTDAVRTTARQLAQAATDIVNQTQGLNGNVQGMGWAGSGREQFVADFEALTGNIVALTDQGAEFGTRLIREVDEWEQTAQGLGSFTPAPTKPFSAWAHSTEVPPLNYALFSDLAYSDSPELPPNLKDAGWEFLGDVGDLTDKPGLEGYQGAAFVNPRTGEVVIAHRGTQEWNFNPFNNQPSDLDDDAQIFAGQIPDQYAVSRQFTAAVQNKLKQDPRFSNYTLVHTGHSLGGALADLNAMTDGSKGITFDNPGTWDIIKNNPDKFSAGDRTNLVNYQSNANLVQLGGTLAGYTVQMIPQDGGTNIDRAVEVGSVLVSPVIGAKVIVDYTAQHHDLNNIINSIDPQTGFPKGYFPPEAGNVDHGWHNLNELKNGKIEGAASAPACYAPPPL